MGKVMLVRHGKKGNGIYGDAPENGRKNFLSPQGEADSRALGLPEVLEGKVGHVGGSELSRSLHTALLIAMSAGCDPQILPSDRRLGSENQLFKEFGITMEDYVKALEANNNIEIDALKAVCTSEQYELLKTQIKSAILEAIEMEGNVILGTHSPWLQIAIEACWGTRFTDNVHELAWVVFEKGKNLPFTICSADPLIYE